ncbi:MAG: vWA domain-containing protein [Streptosporangiales bacterium]
MQTPVQRRGDTRSHRARRPLRRKPKQLEEEPTLFEPSGAGAGAALTFTGKPSGRGTARQGSSAPGETDEAAGVVQLPADGPGPDPAVRARARQIAARLAVPRARRDSTTRRGAGELASVRYRGGSDDIDLDRTVEVLAERPIPDDEDIVVRERIRTRRSVVLAVDVSGSMRGERVRTAAATVGALAADLRRDDVAVIAFWSDAAVLCRLGDRFEPLALLDALLRIPANGLTNVAFPLQVAASELARAPAIDARVVLLSDCVHNAGPDPRRSAARLPRLDVLLDVAGEQDVELARELAAAGHGRAFRIGSYRDVAPALSEVFAS